MTFLEKMRGLHELGAVPWDDIKKAAQRPDVARIWMQLEADDASAAQSATDLWNAHYPGCPPCVEASDEVDRVTGPLHPNRTVAIYMLDGGEALRIDALMCPVGRTMFFFAYVAASLRAA